MRGMHRTLALGFLALASLGLAGASASSKPDTEEAYWHELSRLRSVDKAGALAFAKKGDDWYSNTGGTAEARKAMAITLLVDLGKMDDARRETRAFVAAFPSSPYLPLVEGVTGIHPRPHGPQSNR